MMNRPSMRLYGIEETSENGGGIAIEDKGKLFAYFKDLGKYCTELEHEYKVLKEEYNANQEYIEAFDTTKDWYWKKIKRIEKALEKLCDKLAFASDEHVIEELGSFTFGELNRTKDQWKEWAMNNEI